MIDPNPDGTTGDAAHGFRIRPEAISSPQEVTLSGYPNAVYVALKSRPDHYFTFFNLLTTVGVGTVKELDDALRELKRMDVLVPNESVSSMDYVDPRVERPQLQ